MTLMNVVVAGGGTLGSQIAFQSAFKGKHVVVYDINADAVAKAENLVSSWDDAYRRDMQATEDQLKATHANIKFTDDLAEAVKGADIVVEAIPEVIDIKVDFYTKLAPLLADNTILTTNTSTLLPSEFVDYTGRPEKFLALHFANEIWKNNVAEVMPVESTEAGIQAEVIAFAEEIGMEPVALNMEQPGYILNSLLDPWINAALRLWGRGVAEPLAIDRDWMISSGLAFGPFGLMDMIGLDLIHEIHSHQVAPGDLDLLKGINKLKKMVDAGKLGKKNNHGFYTYPNPEFIKK